jgi:hypothetical protein
MKAKYAAKHDPMIDRLNSELSGDLHALVLALIRGERDENTPVDTDLAAQQARQLYEAGQGKIGTDEGKFWYKCKCKSVILITFMQLSLIMYHSQSSLWYTTPKDYVHYIILLTRSRIFCATLMVSDRSLHSDTDSQQLGADSGYQRFL